MTSPAARARGAGPQNVGWRVATATRVFALALATGRTISEPGWQSSGVLLLGLALLALVASAADAQAPAGVVRLIPVTEGMLAAILLLTSEMTPTVLLVYLAVPPVAAGVRTGWLTVVNTGLGTGVAIVGGWAAATGSNSPYDPLQEAISWVAIGMGAGLLAAWQTRSVRALEESQAPLTEAHRLLTQLHTVSRQLPAALDAESAGQALLAQVSDRDDIRRAVVFVRAGEQTIVPLTHSGPTMDRAEQDVAKRCLNSRRRVVVDKMAALPVRVGEYDVGAIVAHRTQTWRRQDLRELQAAVDRHGLALDTALLFDDVRTLATTEERNRLARDIHDGVAQDVASLGYLIDDLHSSTEDPEVREVAQDLRAEVSRVVGELRHSIFDLRAGATGGTDLPDTLSSYARELGSRGDLRVELTLDVSGEPLAGRVQAELLRIAQEAISNVRKHARATTLWVSLTTDGSAARLEIADDGVATVAPVPRDGHYGLHTMRERAARIDADLTLLPRSEGGTVVTVSTRAPGPPGPDHEQGADE